MKVEITLGGCCDRIGDRFTWGDVRAFVVSAGWRKCTGEMYDPVGSRERDRGFAGIEPVRDNPSMTTCGGTPPDLQFLLEA